VVFEGVELSKLFELRV